MNEILLQEFESIKADLISAYDRKGMRASGKFADNLEVRQTIRGVQLWGENYAQQLETGRQAGKFPPINAIAQWIEDKGIASQLNGEITKNQLAFLIARKIAREGWKREGFGGVELISEVITEQRIQSIIDKVGDEVLLKYTSDIIKMIKEIAV